MYVGTYTHPISKYGSVYTVRRFKQYVKDGFFIDYDGRGRAVKRGKVDVTRYIYPSELDKIPDDATHIVWFNR